MLMEHPVQKHDRFLRTCIYGSAAVFIAILQLTGWFEPSIRTLHLFQSLIYIGILVLCARRNVFGYGAAIGIATFWNTANLFVTTFIRSGWTTLLHLIRTGHAARPELIVAPIAAAAHFVLIAACIAAYLARPTKRRSDLVLLIAGSLTSILAFYGIISIWGRQYLHIFSSMLSWLGIHHFPK
jgi:hypothetical protein